MDKKDLKLLRELLRNLYGEKKYKICKDGVICYYADHIEGNYWAYLFHLGDIDCCRWMKEQQEKDMSFRIR